MFHSSSPSEATSTPMKSLQLGDSMLEDPGEVADIFPNMMWKRRVLNYKY